MTFLVDDNEKYPQVQWNTPVSQLIRDDFVLEDEYLTTHVTLEDALSHRSGMPRHDFSYGDEYRGHEPSIKDIVRSLRHLPLTAELRTKWQYCNMMYVTVSHVMETVTGSFLGDIIKRRILEPLEMKSTYFSMEEAREAPEQFAQGYYFNDGKYHEATALNYVQVSGAGFIISNVLDYAKWIRAMINQSPPISKAGHQALRAPRSFVDQPLDNPPFTGTEAYTLGWVTGVYRGHQWFQHGGMSEAFGADVIFFPVLKYGIVAFGNTAMTSNFAEKALLWHLIDDMLEIPQDERFDWNAKNQATMRDKEKEYVFAKSLFYPSIPSPPLPLSRPLAAYVGTYYHPAYHNMTVTLLPSGSSLNPSIFRIDRTAQLWKMRVELEHVSGEYFIGWLDSLVAPGTVFKDAMSVEFRIGSDGSVAQLGARMEVEMGQEMIWFTRVQGNT
jgi:CubicO group peptidase (beta-lactamase class C family)